MLNLQIIGFLGADAQIVENNGKRFVSFNVSHNEAWNDAQGLRHESTTWVSCALDGDGGALLPYLCKGRQVYVSGRCSVRVYSSPKLKSMVAGLNCSVQRIELVGRVEEFPRELYTEDGVVVKTERLYMVPGELSGKQLHAPDGGVYDVTDGLVHGLVHRHEEA